MNTKIVYALTSDSTDNYLEQLIISIYSLRYYNPSVHIALVIDLITSQAITGDRLAINELIDEKIVIETPGELTKKARSRYIKTSVRQNIEGDYLFIDTDTIVTSDIASIDAFNVDIAAVWDRHLLLFQNQMLDSILDQSSKVGWRPYEADTRYFNSGVMLVKDLPICYKLYADWHEQWYSSYLEGIDIDQPSLAIVNERLGSILKELPGIWNCQILGNGLQYLNNAKIIHYYNTNTRTKLKCNPYIFADNSFFKSVRENRYSLPDDFKNYIEKAKFLFSNKYEILSDEALAAYNSSLVQLVLYFYAFHPKFYHMISIVWNKIYSFYFRNVKRK